MDAIQVMMQEHELIVRVLGALDGFADSPLDTPAHQLELGHFVRFIREYADARHHGKEEHVLFAGMIRNGFPAEGGPVGMMLWEHGQMRELIGALSRFAEQEAPWSDADREHLSDAARSYADMLREHIMKENEMLYPMAMEHLPPRVQEQIDVECAALDQDRARAGGDAALEKLADHLVARYGRAR